MCVFDALHDMGDPVGAARHVRSQLADDGTWMVVEPFAGDAIEDNLNPVGRVFYAGSTMLCTPASLSQEVGLALGAQAGEQRLAEVLHEGGFSRVRRAAETPFNLVLEVTAVAAASAASERRDALTPAALALEPVRLLLGDLDVDARSACRRVERLEPPLEDEVADQAGDRQAAAVGRRCAAPAASGSPGSRRGRS